MKKIIFLFFLILGSSVFSQNENYTQYFKSATPLNASNFDSYIQEVYMDQAQSIRNKPIYAQFQNAFENRMAVASINATAIGKMLNITDVALRNKINANLSYDTSFQVSTFNPLKYNLNFFSNEVQVYKLGQTNQVLIILPQ
jgi:hypothetical protein